MTRAPVESGRDRHLGNRQVARMLKLQREHIGTIVRVLVDDARQTAGKDVSAAGAEEE